MDSNVLQGLAAFEYHALPDDAAYIRLLQILDDDYSEGIKVRCRMTTWPIDNMPSYRALSYTWGDPNSCSTILVNDQVLRVRKNCEFVLKQAYWYQKTSYYWIDAICINQEILTEKGMQVSRMGNVFKQAAQVLACVGDHADDSAFLFRKLNAHPYTKRLLSRDWFQRSSLKAKPRNRFATTARRVEAGIRFLARPYFTRLWTLQELRNAREAVFLCGSHAVRHEPIYDLAHEHLSYLDPLLVPRSGKLASIATSLSKRLPVVQRFLNLQHSLPVHDRISKFYWQNLKDLERADCDCRARHAYHFIHDDAGVWSLLYTADGLECQERKDKTFGVISLIDWAFAASPLPDYTQSELEVAVSFFKALIFSWNRPGDLWLGETLPRLSAIVTEMLHLNSNSTGVPNEIESRHFETGNYEVRVEINAKYTHTMHETTSGWRVTGEHLTKNDAGFLSWSPSGSQIWKLHLPIWAQDGDWIVRTDACTVSDYNTEFVLVREEDDGLGGPIVGRTVSVGFDKNYPVGARFGIHWDPEDLVIASIADQAILRGKSATLSRQHSAEWVQALNTAICKKSTPGSSYAFRCDVVYCERYNADGSRRRRAMGFTPKFAPSDGRTFKTLIGFK